jgi:hypothetical protein
MYTVLYGGELAKDVASRMVAGPRAPCPPPPGGCCQDGEKKDGSVREGPPLDVSLACVCGAEGEKRCVALTAVDMEGFKKLNIDSEATNIIFVVQVVSHPIASTVPLPDAHKRTHACKHARTHANGYRVPPGC